MRKDLDYDKIIEALRNYLFSQGFSNVVDQLDEIIDSYTPKKLVLKETPELSVYEDEVGYMCLVVGAETILISKQAAEDFGHLLLTWGKAEKSERMFDEMLRQSKVGIGAYQFFEVRNRDEDDGIDVDKNMSITNATIKAAETMLSSNFGTGKGK